MSAPSGASGVLQLAPQSGGGGGGSGSSMPHLQPAQFGPACLLHSRSMETSGRYQETVDTDTFHPADPPKYERAEPANPGCVLPLPAPADGASGGQQLEIGERVQMDHLGPLVIGEDGSVGRIANCEWVAATLLAGCVA